MKILCELKVKNLNEGVLVVANAILGGKETKKIPFYSQGQLNGAVSAEKKNLIKIETAIPESLVKKFNLDAKVDKKKVEEDVLAEDKATPVEDVPVEEETTPIEDVPVEEETTPIEDVPVAEGSTLTREAIIAMTAKEMKQHIASDDSLSVEGYSKMNARDLTNNLLEAYGFETLSEDEK